MYNELNMGFNYGDKKATDGIYKGEKLSYIKMVDTPELMRLSLECKDPEIKEAADILIGSLQMLGNHIKYGSDLEDEMHSRALSIAQSIPDLKERGITFEKATKDIAQQLIAQWCIRELLSPFYKSLPIPDVSVYESGNKDFRDEFVDKNTGQRICVKTQDVERKDKYTVSWIYNIYEYLFTKELPHYDPLTKVCFAQTDKDAKTVRILAILNAETPHKYSLFAEPFKLDYVKTKKVVYLKGIPIHDVKGIETEGIDKCEL